MAESITVKEVIVDDDAVVVPARAPSPESPTSPVGETKADVKADAESEAESGVKEWRIKSVNRRPPNIERIINRNINHVRVSRLDHYDPLSVVIPVYDFLLRR